MKSLSPWESRPERPERVCITLVVFILPLAFTTYQAGKLLLLGLQPDGRLAVFERTFNRCMGLHGDSQTLWMSSLSQLWRFENVLAPGELYNGGDRLYVPRVGYTTGDLDIHDIAVEASGRVVFVNTRFGCLATLSEQSSFTPLWRPSLKAIAQTIDSKPSRAKARRTRSRRLLLDCLEERAMLAAVTFSPAIVAGTLCQSSSCRRVRFSRAACRSELYQLQAGRIAALWRATWQWTNCRPTHHRSFRSSVRLQASFQSR